MPLTNDQSKAEALMFNQTPGTSVAISGAPGTGKTYVVTNAIRKMVQDDNRIVVALAPTNKALGVLTENLNSEGLEPRTIKTMKTAESFNPPAWGNYAAGQIFTGTLHQFLKGRPNFKDKKDGSLERAFDPTVTSARGARIDPEGRELVVVVDEASMLDTVLNNTLTKVLETSKNKMSLVYVGDQYQLPPVKAEAANVLIDPERPTVDMTTIVRQAEGSGIRDLVRDLREGTDVDWRSYGDDVRVFETDEDFKQNYLDSQKEGGKTEKEWAVGVAWTNNCVQSMNRDATECLYDTSETEFAAGQLALVQNPLQQKCLTGDAFKETVFTTSEAVEVIECEEEFNPDEFTVDGRVYSVRSKEVRLRSLSSGRVATARLVPEVEQKNLKTLTKALAAYAKKMTGVAKKEPSKDRMRKDAWIRFFEISEETYVSLRHIFAITAHKSQGSTYREVFVNVRDIMRQRDEDERRKLLYVACSRAAEKVYVLL